jgi:hypothetical protein
MALLLLISVPFAILGFWGARLWTILIPFAFWLVFAWLGTIGVVPGETSFNAALLAGALGALFAGLGMAARIQLRPRRGTGI